MVFGQFQENVVVEKGWASNKSIKKMTLGIALWTILLSVGLGLVTLCTVGTLLTLVVLVLLGVGFIWVFDLADESEDNLKLTMKVARLWWVMLIIDIVIFLLLKFFNFL